MPPKKTEKEDKVDAIKSLVKNAISENKEHVYSNRKKVDYRVSSGSFRLDEQLGGGIPKGITRLAGYTTAGKTSELFQIVANAFKAHAKCRCIYVPAEGRDNIKVMDRLGIRYTEDIDEWDNHTVYAFVTNVYETVADLVYQMVKANESLKETEREIFILAIDSLDCLMLKDDMEKSASESHKVAGPQLLSKTLWKRLAIPFNYGGHMALITSMQSTEIKLDPYAKTPKRTTSGAGGTAMNHFANTILEFRHRNMDDYILEDESNKKYDPVKNPRIGHDVTIFIIKSDNEKYDTIVKYPIKYGANGEGSIWKSREILEMALERDLFIKSGNSFEPSPILLNSAKEANIKLKEKVVGMKRLYAYLEEDNQVTGLMDKILKTLMAAEKMAQYNKAHMEPVDLEAE